MKLNDKKTINAWALFDWANSAYALVISTAIFPGYFEEYSPDIIQLGGLTFSNTALYSFAVSFSFLLIACVSPLLSGIADFSGRRMTFLKIFTLIGSISCCLLYYFVDESKLWLGTSAFVLATIGFSGSIVFYDSYLPLIVSEDNYNRVSAKGYTYGYIGSVILLIFILIMVLKPDWFGLSGGQMGSRIGFVLVGLWWVGFSQYTFRYLPREVKKKFNPSMIKEGYREVGKAFTKIKSMANVKSFLLSFWFVSAGVQTVIYLATLFAKQELHFATSELIIVVLIIQLVAIGGAYLFSYLGLRSGNKYSIQLMTIIWIIICIAAAFTYDKVPFYILAIAVGLVMGGIQSLSRASYSMILPEGERKNASYFSFYDVVYKTAVVGGTFIFGLVDNLTNDMRYSVISLAVLFVVGFFFMSMTKIPSQSISAASAID
jgi:MFS transporter, UMF1 family